MCDFAGCTSNEVRKTRNSSSDTPRTNWPCVSVRNHPRFFGDDDDDRVSFLTQADGRAMPRAERGSSRVVA